MKMLVLGFALIVFLTSCSIQEVESLMRAPKPPFVYEHLRDPVLRFMGDKYEFASPVGGYDRQSIQTVDIDRDGHEEAVVFLRSKTDRLLSVHIFSQTEDGFVLTGSIENNCDTIESVAYKEVSQSGRLDIIIVWRNGNVLRVLTVHSVDGSGVPAVILSSDFADHIVFQDNKGQDRLILFKYYEQLSAEAELLGFSDNMLIPISSCKLSFGAQELRSAQQGRLLGNAPAVFAVSRINDKSFVTDVVLLQNEELSNITAWAESGVSEETLISVEEYPRDLDANGITDIPIPEALPHYDAGAVDADPVYKLVWMNVDTTGHVLKAYETYNSVTGNWYFILPEEWSGHITVKRSDSSAAVRSVLFALLRESGPPVDLINIFSAQKTGGLPIEPMGSLLLLDRSDISVFAEILQSPSVNGFVLGEIDLRERIKFMPAEWE